MLNPFFRSFVGHNEIIQLRKKTQTKQQRYVSTAMASYTESNLEGFPVELLPIRMNAQHFKGVNEPSIRCCCRRREFGYDFSVSLQQAFTASFIAGMYHDTRMGVAELRSKRLDRLRQKQAVIENKKQAVQLEVDRIIEHRKQRAARTIERARKRKEHHIFRSTMLIQKLIRHRIAKVGRRRGHFSIVGSD